MHGRWLVGGRAGRQAGTQADSHADRQPHKSDMRCSAVHTVPTTGVTRGRDGHVPNVDPHTRNQEPRLRRPHSPRILKMGLIKLCVRKGLCKISHTPISKRRNQGP
eukprot:jgi/Mesvir1/29451/Mv26069-RA.1